jgi:glycyl-tRNA synthetase
MKLNIMSSGRSAIEMAFISRFGKENYRFHDHEKLAHYANAASDIEFNFPWIQRIRRNHSRTDFDLKHEKFSGRKLQYFDAELNQNYVPYVVETSVGLDRMFLVLQLL